MSVGFSWKWRTITPFVPRSKHRPIRCRHVWTKRSPEKKSSRNEAQPYTIDQWALRTAHSKKEKVGEPSGRPPDGRPAHGPHRLQASTWHSLIGSQRRFQGFPADSTTEERVAPHYIYEGRGSISRHHQASSYQVTLSRCSSSSLVEVLGLEEFGFES